MNRPLRHISIRVPWHDTGWDGRVCEAPRLNGACLNLKRIAENRDDDAEEAIAGKTLQELSHHQWPPCVPERMGFMASLEYTRFPNHPYNRGSETSHGHFKDTPLRHPPYSAPAVPFYWMLRQNLRELAEAHSIDVNDEREPDLGFEAARTWVQNRENQNALLECFRSHIKPDKSLCFFYAKQVPFVEDAKVRRILIGVGRVLHVTRPQEYDYATKDLTGKLRSMLWELMVQHSIRPGFKDGFLLPYHAAIRKSEDDEAFDPADVAAFTPVDRLPEFSHASQLVTHDGAIASLLSCGAALRRVRRILPGEWDHCLDWIDARLGDLWRARGPCPGLGPALSAFGLELGTFVAHALIEEAGENADPWPLVEAMFAEPDQHLPPELARGVGKTLRAKWERLPDDRRTLLKLLSRFELSGDQAKLLYVREERASRGIGLRDEEIIDNPYTIFEATRLTNDPVSVWTVDRGVFPPSEIRTEHPLPEPSELDAGTDARRVRALCTSVLEDAADEGNTLLPESRVVLVVRNLAIQPACAVDADLMDVAKDDFDGVIDEIRMADASPALQLTRLSAMGAVIRDALEKRIKGKRHSVKADWRKRLDDHLKQQGAGEIDEQEEQARTEKVAALKELSMSRLSVLIGQAGTGKTTLLAVLCAHPDIASGGILLLAPTGKARVRMEQSTKGLRLTGYTIAQFLSPDRYDGTTGRYRLSTKLANVDARTVIIDEASMLTEEMLAALLQTLKGVQRLVLIGDPRQLPPIGAGRPFIDVVHRLAPDGLTEMFPRTAVGYAELTIRRRQAGEHREDLQLAEWFSGAPIAPGEDDVFDRVVHKGQSKRVRFVQWDSADELRSRLVNVLVDELKLSAPDDIEGFDATLGGEPWNELRFFNTQGNGKRGAAQTSEGWQILSPVRSAAHGVADLNRFIHKRFRQHTIDAAQLGGNRRKYPKPMGVEQIVYGDKVINLINTDPTSRRYRHRRVFPDKDHPYIANGEIGMAVGYYWRSEDRRKGRDFRWKLEVEFSSQPGYKYDFTERDFREESSPPLELAYALTVHKSQGSEFGIVILVLPNPCRLLSRELLYTALTRQRKRVVILHQGARRNLKKFTSDDHSETARRLTNLFVAPSPIEIDGRFFEEHLIHRTSRGEMVRSKSEVIIADHLANNGIEYRYEQDLTIDGVTKSPDFTIEDAESGENYYWEHCGMLHVPSYSERWEEKLAWYRCHKIIPYQEGGGSGGTLIVTRDEPNGSIDSARIKQIILDVLGR